MRKSVNSGKLTHMRNMQRQQADAGQTVVIGEQGNDPMCAPERANTTPKLREVGGPKGAEPTRFGDWERAGRCIDF